MAFRTASLSFLSPFTKDVNIFFMSAIESAFVSVLAAVTICLL